MVTTKRHDAKHQALIKPKSWGASVVTCFCGICLLHQNPGAAGCSDVAGRQCPVPRQLAPCIFGRHAGPHPKKPQSHAALSISSRKHLGWRGRRKGVQGRGGSCCPAIDLVQLVTAGTAHSARGCERREGRTALEKHTKAELCTARQG